MPTVEAEHPYFDDGKPSRPASSQDGQGGDTSTRVVKAGARYVYYRLYSKDGALESNNPIYSNDRFISRILSGLVRPPQTAASLKKYICKIEGLGAFESCNLYQSPSEPTSLDDSARLLFRGTSGPGLSDQDPMALVADVHVVKKRSHAASIVDPSKLVEREYDQRYVYYRIYDEDGGVVSKTSYDENNPFLGRVSTLSIPPPHTAGVLKAHTIKCEEISGHNVQIFEDEGSDSAMKDSDAVTLLSDTFPGFTEDEPIAITYESEGPGTNISPVDKADPKDILVRDLQAARSALEESQKLSEMHVHELAQVKEELEKAKETHTRELLEARSALDRLKEEFKQSSVILAFVQRQGISSPALIQALLQRPTFTKIIRAPLNWTPYYRSPEWHYPVNKGDIFYTDGILRQGEWHYESGPSTAPCYDAISSSGRVAFVFEAFMRPS